MEQSVEKAFDITTELAAGDVDIRALQEANQFVATGVVVGYGASDTEDVQGVLVGQNSNVTIPMRCGMQHKYKFSTIRGSAGATTTERVLVVGI